MPHGFSAPTRTGSASTNPSRDAKKVCARLNDDARHGSLPGIQMFCTRVHPGAGGNQQARIALVQRVAQAIGHELFVQRYRNRAAVSNGEPRHDKHGAVASDERNMVALAYSRRCQPCRHVDAAEAVVALGCDDEGLGWRV